MLSVREISAIEILGELDSCRLAATRPQRKAYLVEATRKPLALEVLIADEAINPGGRCIDRENTGQNEKCSSRVVLAGWEATPSGGMLARNVRVLQRKARSRASRNAAILRAQETIRKTCIAWLLGRVKITVHSDEEAEVSWPAGAHCVLQTTQVDVNIRLAFPSCLPLADSRKALESRRTYHR